jgi:Rieske 2Fe-2S family protein
MATFLRTIESYVQGARTLPRRYYASNEVLAEEWERLFAKTWLCIGRSSSLAEGGAYVTRQIGHDNVIVLRDRTGTLRAYHNVCRHRGTRLCEAAQGQLKETIQCPYHAWTYALDGRLIGAPHMHETEGFDKRDYPLHGVAVTEWEGFVFVNLSRDPVPFAEFFAPVFTRFSRFNLSGLAIQRRIEYDVKANWKLVLQNYNECLHCPTIHPMLARTLPYTSGANDLTEGPFLGGYMEIAQPNESATVSGRACGLLVGDLQGDDLHRAYYYSLFPNMMLSMHPDYVVYYMVWPVDATRSTVISEWMFNPTSMESPDFDPSGAVEFWDVTNLQDWHICEQSQLGVLSSVYAPGPYSPRESVPAAWDRTYLAAMEVSTRD